MIKNDNVSIAENYFNKACILHNRGNILEAIENFKQSIRYNPTSKAHYWLACAYGLQGRYQAAIDQCVLATDIDPDHGNPYNDIGSYLINLERFDEAVEWFDKAQNALFNAYRFYPFYNLGRIAEINGEWEEAIICYSKALELKPSYKAAEVALIRVYSYLN